jgi:hypothetical protein
MVGAHLAFMHGGSGATDNAGRLRRWFMEAMRVHAALDLHLDRTVSHWTLEREKEQRIVWVPSFVCYQPLWRTRGYDEIGNPIHSTLILLIFNVDNGSSGKIRGIQLQGNEHGRPDFRKLAGAVP